MSRATRSRWLVGSTAQHGAVVLGAPGAFVEETAAGLRAGYRPARAHLAMVAVTLPAGLGAAWILVVLAGLPWLGLVFLLLFGVVPLVPLFNRWQWEVRPGRLAMRGTMLGWRVHRDYAVDETGAVRVDTWQEADGDSGHRWPVYQAQLRCGAVWVGVAEAAMPEPVQAFAGRLAAAAGVPLLASAPD